MSTNVRSRVACNAHVCFGNECRTLRIDDMRIWATIGDGCPSKSRGKSNSFVVSRDNTFSEDMFSVIV